MRKWRFDYIIKDDSSPTKYWKFEQSTMHLCYIGNMIMFWYALNGFWVRKCAYLYLCFSNEIYEYWLFETINHKLTQANFIWDFVLVINFAISSFSTYYVNWEECNVNPFFTSFETNTVFLFSWIVFQAHFLNSSRKTMIVSKEKQLFLKFCF